MNKLVYGGFVVAIGLLAASCGPSIEFADTTGNGGEGGKSSSGSNTTGVGAGSTGSTTSTSGGQTSSSSGGMTSSSSGGMTSSSSGGMTSSSSSGGMVCPSFGDPCSECLALQCADIYCSCYGNFDCFSLSTCLNGCNGDATCEQQCYATHPDGAAVLYALSNCGGVNCSVDCPGTQPLDPCTTCMVETCEGEFNACLSSASCLNLYQCLSGCAPLDLACNQKCYATFGDGVPLLQKLLDCSKSNCPDC